MMDGTAHLGVGKLTPCSPAQRTAAGCGAHVGMVCKPNEEDSSRHIETSYSGPIQRRNRFRDFLTHFLLLFGVRSVPVD